MSSAARARWLAELAAALGEAQAVTWRLGMVARRPELGELYSRIEFAIEEVRALRLGGRREEPDEDDPEWSNNLPWVIR